MWLGVGCARRWGAGGKLEPGEFLDPSHHQPGRSPNGKFKGGWGLRARERKGCPKAHSSAQGLRRAAKTRDSGSAPGVKGLEPTALNHPPCAQVHVACFVVSFHLHNDMVDC